MKINPESNHVNQVVPSIEKERFSIKSTTVLSQKTTNIAMQFFTNTSTLENKSLIGRVETKKAG